MDQIVLSLKNVGKKYGDRVLFQNVDLSLRRGEVAVIIGKNGAGKTTLLKIIAGLISFEGGVEIEGIHLDNDNLKNNSSVSVLVSQQPNLWQHLTAQDNVALIRRVLHKETKHAARKKADEYLRLVEVEARARQYPSTLSGGEQQRVSLARGLAAERQLLLLDEVTSNIDPSRRLIVAKAILKLANDGKTIVFVTHDLPTAELVTPNPLLLTQAGLIKHTGYADSQI